LPGDISPVQVETTSGVDHLRAKKIPKMQGKEAAMDAMPVGKNHQNPTWWFQIFFIFTPTWGNDPI